MNLRHCEREQHVMDAIRAGRWAGPWGEEIRRHAAGCPVCAEVALVAEALNREADYAQTESGAKLPGAGLVWWKAQLAARRAAEARAFQPIAWVERMAEVFGVVALLGLALWQWPTISRWLRAPGAAARGSQISSGTDWTQTILHSLAFNFSQSPGYLLFATALAFMAFVAFAAYLVWREE